MPEFTSKEVSENDGGQVSAVSANEEVVAAGDVQPKVEKEDAFSTASATSTSKSKSKMSDGARAEVADDVQLKRRSNMDRCRKYRERRKQQEESVYTENAALKRERLEFQQQIIQLEMEVQQLRSQGRIDAEKENELLRSEVSKHQRYVNQVVRIANHGSLEVEAEEERKVLRDGAEASKGHIAGMMYSSMTDTSWITLPVYEVLEGVTIQIRYQLLPLGSALESAERINIRTDCTGLPISSDQLFHNIAEVQCNVTALKATSTNQNLFNKHVTLEEVHPIIPFGEDGFIACVRCLVPKHAPKREAIVVHLGKTIDLYPSAFALPNDANHDVDFLLAQQRYRLLMSTTSNIKVPGSQLERATKFHSEGYTVKEGQIHVSNFTHVVTTVARHPHAKALVNRIGEDGRDTLKDTLVASWRDLVETFLHVNDTVVSEGAVWDESIEAPAHYK